MRLTHTSPFPFPGLSNLSGRAALSTIIRATAPAMLLAALLPALLAALLCLSPCPASAAQPEAATARSVGAGDGPGFFVTRAGARLDPSGPEMKLYEGDVVTPLPGRKVEIIHRSTACGSVVAEAPFTVACASRPKGGGGFLKDAFNGYLEDMKGYIYRTPQKEAHSETTRGVGLKKPGDIFQTVTLPSWPMDGAMVLSGEPIQFQWGQATPDEAKNGAGFTLIVARSSAPGEAVATRPLKGGQLATLPPDLPPGDYLWRAELGGLNVSGDHPFRILDQATSAAVKADLAAFEKDSREECVVMGKAVYLQMRSQAGDGLDLFPDSLRLAATGNCFLNPVYNMVFIRNLDDYLKDKAPAAPAQ